jgi:hypothetical protein
MRTTKSRAAASVRKILFTMHMRGQTSKPSDQPQSLRTTGSAASCNLNTTISDSGIQTSLTPSDGDLAFFESELRLIGPDEFQEAGEITFGDNADHVLRFSTTRNGHFTKAFEPGTIAGSASWRVESGEGQFASARGFITSNFTITASGERCDMQAGIVFVPE